MEDIIESIESCLNTQNPHGALIIALIIPDICAGLELGETNRERYTAWFDKYSDDLYSGHMTGSDCYAIRCSFLHQGIVDVQHQKVQINQKKSNPSANVIDKFSFCTGGSHLISIRNSTFGSRDDGKNMCHLDVKEFCDDMIKSVKKWLLDVESLPEVQQRIKELPKITIGASLFDGAISIDN